jgi:hypothetical protein
VISASIWPGLMGISSALSQWIAPEAVARRVHSPTSFCLLFDTTADAQFHLSTTIRSCHFRYRAARTFGLQGQPSKPAHTVGECKPTVSRDHQRSTPAVEHRKWHTRSTGCTNACGLPDLPFLAAKQSAACVDGRTYNVSSTHGLQTRQQHLHLVPRRRPSRSHTSCQRKRATNDRGPVVVRAVSRAAISRLPTRLTRWHERLLGPKARTAHAQPLC